MELTSLFALISLGFLGYVFVNDYQKRKANKVPGPPPMIIFGNTFENIANFDRILDWQWENTLKYGLTWSFTMLGQPRRIMTSDPANVEHILKKNFENYEKGESFRVRLHDFLGDGIFNADGEQWKTQRKIASNIFNVKNFRDNMCEVFVQHGKEVIGILENLKPGEAINMHDLFHRFTLDSIGSIAFGVDIGSIHDSTAPFARAFDFAQWCVMKRFVSPFWSLRKYYSQDEVKFRESMKIMDDFCYKIVRNRRTHPREGDTSTDLLSLFMNKTNTNGEEYSDEYLKDMMLNFIIAGRDTTANGLSWAFNVLNSHHEVEDKLVEEIKETFGDELPDFRVKQMKYATAFVSETLRLHPSVPKDPKSAVADDIFPDGTEVKAGDWIVYLPWTMGRLEALWGKDAVEFKPERWLDEGAKPSPFKYPVFQAGPRTCLGQDMAYLEMKVMTVMILQKFKLRLVPGQNITYMNNITLPMKDFSMMMTVEKRE